MDLDDIKRGLRAEIKKRENEQYATFQCNVRQMCKDVLAKLEELESEIADKDEQLRHSKYKRCLAMSDWCEARYDEEDARINGRGASWDYESKEMKYWERWRWRWLELAQKFKPNKE